MPKILIPAVFLGLAMSLVGCSSGSGSGAVSSGPASPSQSSVSLSSNDPVPADGASGAEVRVVLRDASGVVVANALVEFASADSGVRFWPGLQQRTGRDGSCSVIITRTDPGMTEVAVSVDGSPLTQRPNVNFVPTTARRGRISVASNGSEAQDSSGGAATSGNGAVIAFHSLAANLVSGDSNGQEDVFVHVLGTNATERVSLKPDGSQFRGPCRNPSLSDDGLIVAFEGRDLGLDEIFVHDRSTGLTTAISQPAGLSGRCHDPAISGDGRFVAFVHEQGRDDQVWVVDRLTLVSELVSQATNGAIGNDDSEEPSISRDGRLVAFTSEASNLVVGDTNARDDVFVRDRVAGTTLRVSVSSTGGQGTGDSEEPSIAADGRFVAFASHAPNLVPGDTNGRMDVFRKDLLTGELLRISVDSSGRQVNADSEHPSISAGGNFIAFSSESDALVPGDNNREDDVFVRDVAAGLTRRVSQGIGNRNPNEESEQCSLAADAAVVAFTSEASNLVIGDTNNRPDVFVAPRD